jgi:hypothetical protein
VDVGAAVEAEAAEAADVKAGLEGELCAEELVFAQMEVAELLVIVLLIELGVKGDTSTTRLVKVRIVDVSDAVVIDVEVDTVAVLITLPPGASYHNIISIYCSRHSYE